MRNSFERTTVGGGNEKTSRAPIQGLYEIRERPDGRFSVPILMGAAEIDGNELVSTSLYNSREEAEIAIEKNKQYTIENREFRALKSSFTKQVFIRRSGDSYVVGGPGLVDQEGNMFGSGTFFAETWEEAKSLYASNREKMERRVRGELMTVGDGKNRVAFSSVDAWNPEIRPGDPVIPLPDQLRRSTEKSEDAIKRLGTYEMLVGRENWSGEVVDFIVDLLRKEAKEVLKDLSIEDIRALSPRQAMEVSTKLVLLLTKYNWNSLKEHGPTAADTTDALTLLKEGRKHRKNKDWEGNGVCRNFAAMSKVVFDALKSYQRPSTSQLNNVYALYENDLMAFDPRQSRVEEIAGGNFAERGIKGHAWNAFAAVRKDGTETVITDSTWGKFDLDTRKTVNLDHTLTRMEPAVFDVVRGLNWDKIPDRDQREILGYYATKLAYTGGVDAVLDRGEAQSHTKEELAAKGFELAKDRGVRCSRESAEMIGKQYYHEVEALLKEYRKTERETRAKDERIYFAGRLWQLMEIQGIKSVPKEVVGPLIEYWNSHANKEVGADSCSLVWNILSEQRDPRREEVVAPLLKKMAHGMQGVRFLSKSHDKEFLRFAFQILPDEIRAARRPGSELDKALTIAGVT